MVLSDSSIFRPIPLMRVRLSFFPLRGAVRSAGLSSSVVTFVDSSEFSLPAAVVEAILYTS